MRRTKALMLLFCIFAVFYGCSGKDVSCLNMVRVPVPEGGIVFPSGLNDNLAASVDQAYYLGETEMTWTDWKTVLEWAVDDSMDHDGDGETGDDVYTFANKGQRGNDSAGLGASDDLSVTGISWRDCIVFCNALTEYQNRTQRDRWTCVYYTDPDYSHPLRSSVSGFQIHPEQYGSVDAPYIYSPIPGNQDPVFCTADGYRLPTTCEWELAARWCGRNDRGKTGLISHDEGKYKELTEGYYWIPGNCASGLWEDTAEGLVPICETGTAIIGSENEKGPNPLGIYDMSEHVWELCFDWHEAGKTRVLRDGSRDFFYANYQPVGADGFFSPYTGNFNMGFRLARTDI